VKSLKVLNEINSYYQNILTQFKCRVNTVTVKVTTAEAAVVKSKTN